MTTSKLRTDFPSLETLDINDMTKIVSAIQPVADEQSRQIQAGFLDRLCEVGEGTSFLLQEIASRKDLPLPETAQVRIYERACRDRDLMETFLSRSSIADNIQVRIATKGREEAKAMLIKADLPLCEEAQKIFARDVEYAKILAKRSDLTQEAQLEFPLHDKGGHTIAVNLLENDQITLHEDVLNAFIVPDYLSFSDSNSRALLGRPEHTEQTENIMARIPNRYFLEHLAGVAKYQTSHAILAESEEPSVLTSLAGNPHLQDIDAIETILSKNDIKDGLGRALQESMADRLAQNPEMDVDEIQNLISKYSAQRQALCIQAGMKPEFVHTLNM